MPAGVVAAGFVDLGISLTILFVIVLAWGVVPSLAVLVLPLLVAIMAAAALGVSAGALGAQRPLSRHPLRGPVRDPDVAVRDTDRLPEQPA
jgi:hypothetical protein